MISPRLALALLLAAACPAAFAQGGKDIPPSLPSVEAGAPAARRIVVLKKNAVMLARLGWNLRSDGALVRAEGEAKGLVPLKYLGRAGIEWREGSLYFMQSPEMIPEEMLAPILKGLSSFAGAARVERAQAGRMLAAWGLPPSVDGRRLYNPGGEATYFGVMLHSFFAAKPDQPLRLGVERMSQALDLLDHAYIQAFVKQAPDVAQTDLDRARLILFAAVREGETPLGPWGLKARPDPAAMLKDYKAALQAETEAALKAGDQVRSKDSAQALAVLNTLEKHRFHGEKDLDKVPSPESAKAAEGAAKTAGAAPKGEPYAPLASGLPGLLKVLDRVYGGSLTAEQQENLIKSFPMGDLVWRMGAQDLWRQGLTGKGVKVAVIDQGIAEHPELDGSVKGRSKSIADRGKGAVGFHGTHVAGIIHALAPDAELRGYAVFQNDDGNAALSEASDAPIIDAIHRAVKDGNQIINMSLAGSQGPSNETARVVETYASQGVVFLIAAGNSRNSAGGIGSPSSAPSAITVGALDSAGRMADFSSFGERFDSRKLAAVVKDVFLVPGKNIVSTLPAAPFSFVPQYGALSGTSMATPGLAGVTSLLVQEVGRMRVVPGPIETAQRLKSALALGSTPMALDKLPPNAPLDQPFFVVNPLKALDALRAESAPVAAKK